MLFSLPNSYLYDQHTALVVVHLWWTNWLIDCWLVTKSVWLCNLVKCRLLCPWDFWGKNTAMDCHFLLQGIFPTQGLNRHLRHWQTESLLLSYGEAPKWFKSIAYTIGFTLVWGFDKCIMTDIQFLVCNSTFKEVCPSSHCLYHSNINWPPDLPLLTYFSHSPPSW